jgi:hypothetical protein
VRAGKLIRQGAALDAADAKQCPGCGHPLGQHFELPYGSVGYKPLVFHCKVEGCSCAHAAGAA